MEARAFTGLDDEEQALAAIYDMCEVAVVKLGDRGSLIKADGRVIRVPIYPVTVVNSNGAGDAYAAGILFSIAHGIDLRAGREDRRLRCGPGRRQRRRPAGEKPGSRDRESLTYIHKENT